VWKHTIKKSMQKQEIREVVKLRMIGDSIFGERKGNQDARDRSLMFGMEGKMDGHLSLTQLQSIYLEISYLSKVAFPFVFEISSDKLTRKFWFQRCILNSIGQLVGLL
jgi:hypothetical protein